MVTSLITYSFHHAYRENQFLDVKMDDCIHRIRQIEFFMIGVSYSLNIDILYIPVGANIDGFKTHEIGLMKVYSNGDLKWVWLLSGSKSY